MVNVTLGCDNNYSINFTNEALKCISGFKYNNCTGLGMGGWHIEVFNASTGISVGNATTNSTGFWQVCNLLHGVYRVKETLQPNYKNVTALNQTVTLGCTNLTGVNFFNDPLLCISGNKFNNCTKLGLPGWDDKLTNDSSGRSRPDCHDQRHRLLAVSAISRPGSLHHQRDPAIRLLSQ